MIKRRVAEIRRRAALSPLGGLGRGVVRVVPIIGGAALFIYGLARRDRAGLVAAVAGGGLVLRQVRQGQRALEEVPMLRIEESIIVGRPIEEVYAYWRDFGNLAKFMTNLEAVRSLGRGRSVWVATIPGTKRKISWQAELLEDREHERLRWRSVAEAEIYNEGEVYFRRLPNGGGTEIDVRIAYEPPVGKLMRTVATFLLAIPETFLRDDLERFKRMVETGGEGDAATE